jgi:hypothetical protein
MSPGDLGVLLARRPIPLAALDLVLAQPQALFLRVLRLSLSR